MMTMQPSTEQRRRRWLIAVTAIVAALAVGYLAGRKAMHEGEPTASTPAGMPARTDTAAQAVADPFVEAADQPAAQQLQAEVQRLAGELEALRDEVEWLSEQLGRQADMDTPSGSEDVRERPVGIEALTDAGIDTPIATWIQQRLDDIGLDELYLKDRATREGWMNTSRYRKALRGIRERRTGLREEIADDATYDRLLYAIGQNNRIVIADIMQNSPAEQYGLKIGDVLIAYDGRRVFNHRELHQTTAAGTAGSMVLVEVERGGERVDVYLPRGPIGGRISAARIRP